MLLWEWSLSFGTRKVKSVSDQMAFKSMIGGKCPQCRQEKMFTHGTYHPKFLNMHKTCSHCGLQYEREPGFFYGAMYISYGFSVAIVLVAGFLVYFLGSDPEASVYITVVVIASIVLYPINFRYSRILFIHLFAGMKYDPEKAS